MKRVIENLKELEAFAKEFFGTCTASADRAAVVVLSGDLGAGKTAFVKMLACVLGVTETVVSPTFNIFKTYHLLHQSYATLVHVDAYRLDNSKELIDLGWEKIIQDPKNLVMVEWGEKFPDILPKKYTKISFHISKHISNTQRIIEVVYMS